MPTTTMTTAQKITILKHLVADRDFAFAAASVQCRPENARLVATSHGYPDKSRMRWAIETLEQQDNAIPERTELIPIPAPRPAPQPATPMRPATDAPRDAVVEWQELIARGKRSPKARTQLLAKKIETLTADLLQRVQAEAAEAKAAAAAESRKEETRREIAELEEKLRVAKAALSTKPAQSAARTITVKHGEFPCRIDGCSDIRDTLQGRSMHERRAHGDLAAAG